MSKYLYIYIVYNVKKNDFFIVIETSIKNMSTMEIAVTWYDINNLPNDEYSKCESSSTYISDESLSCLDVDDSEPADDDNEPAGEQFLYYNHNEPNYGIFEIDSFCLESVNSFSCKNEFFYPVEDDENIYKSNEGRILKYVPSEYCAYIDGSPIDVEYGSDYYTSKYGTFIPYYDEDECIYFDEKLYFYDGENYIAEDEDIVETYDSQDYLLIDGTAVYRYLLDGTGYLYSHLV